MKVDTNAAPAADAQWHDIAPGIRIQALSPSGPLTMVARAYARRVLVEAKDDPSALVAAGWPEGEPVDLADEDVRAGVMEYLFELRLAQQTIKAWEGFTDPEDNPVPVSADAIRAVAAGDNSRGVFEMFVMQQNGILEALERAKNASRLSAAGTSAAGGRDTAGDARTSGSPARAAKPMKKARSARTTKTTFRPKPKPKPGK